MPYNYSKLLGRIVERVGTQSRLAERMEMSERTISLKLNGKVGWKQTEIAKACNVLEIRDVEIPNYFLRFMFNNIEHKATQAKTNGSEGG